MITVMEMSTGKIIENEFEDFEDEVLNAEWLPPRPELGLGLQEVQPAPHHADRRVDETEAADFLDMVYRNQG